MEKTARRNITAIYEDWRIFRKILKHDLALDRTSGQRGNRRRVVGEDDLGSGFEIGSSVPTVEGISSARGWTSPTWSANLPLRASW